MAKLDRTVFRTSRFLDFTSERELTAQVGHDRKDWPLLILKELLDNSLDACEEAATPPDITVAVDRSGITVVDNGPGLPTTTVDDILDFSVRVSSREAYCSPTRGAQGNAWKTVLAIPFVLDGTTGRVDISTGGFRHEITFAVDQIRQEPAVSLVPKPACDVRNGTAVKVWWPNSACSLLTDAKARFLQLASDYTFLNPHLDLSIDWFGAKTRTGATAPAWEKWRPSDPTCPHWYTQEAFERLAAAYVTHDQDHGTDRSVRQMVAEFRGLTGTARQKVLLAETNLSRINLSALVNGHGLEHELLEKLLTSMKTNTKAVKPAALGVIGKEHLEKRFCKLGCEMDTFQYKKVAQVGSDGLPVVIETAFAWRGEKPEPRRIITGVNWSPGIVNPFRSLGNAYGDGLTALLEKRHAGSDEPIVFLLHCACPRVRYTDRGKSAVVVK